jgi:hypothetical protein
VTIVHVVSRGVARIYRVTQSPTQWLTEASRGGFHNVDFNAPGVVTTINRVGRCVAVHDSQGA